MGIENVSRNKSLLGHIILHNINKLKINNGLLFITLLKTQFEKWDTIKLIDIINNDYFKNSKMKIYYLNHFLFLKEYWKGYESRRHQNGKSFKYNYNSFT